MSLAAMLSLSVSITLQAGPVASIVYIVPFTSPHVNPVIDAPVRVLIPTFPVITDGGISVIADFARITKFPAVPRFTAVALFAITPGIIAAVIRQINAAVTTMEKRFPVLFFVPVMVYSLKVILYAGNILFGLFHLLLYGDRPARMAGDVPHPALYLSV
jgi:hypothetical protein